MNQIFPAIPCGSHPKPYRYLLSLELGHHLSLPPKVSLGRSYAVLVQNFTSWIVDNIELIGSIVTPIL